LEDDDALRPRAVLAGSQELGWCRVLVPYYAPDCRLFQVRTANFFAPVRREPAFCARARSIAQLRREHRRSSCAMMSAA